MRNHKCLSCEKVVDLDAGGYWSAPSVDIEDGEPVFCCETCIVNYFGLKWVEAKEPIKYIRTVHLDADGTKRRFRCYNINHCVGTECAIEILEELLQSAGLTLDLSGDYDEEIYDLIEKAKTKQLKRTIPEVIIEIVGNIEDNKIEDLLSDEISEATGWLHEGFEFEEIKDKLFALEYYDKTIKVKIDVAAYKNNSNLALQLITEDNEPFATITTNINKLESKTQACIDTNNCPWAPKFIEDNKLGVCIQKFIKSGRCEYPVYEFFLEQLK